LKKPDAINDDKYFNYAAEKIAHNVHIDDKIDTKFLGDLRVRPRRDSVCTI
jgi:hypothetical protein